jgi:two-component system sensor kinase FixL
MADAERLTVLLNRLTNSAQAMEGAGAIRVSIDARESVRQFVVADDGPGVTPEVRGRLFTRFLTTKARGSGLCRRSCKTA